MSSSSKNNTKGNNNKKSTTTEKKKKITKKESNTTKKAQPQTYNVKSFEEANAEIQKLSAELHKLRVSEKKNQKRKKFFFSSPLLSTHSQCTLDSAHC